MSLKEKLKNLLKKAESDSDLDEATLASELEKLSTPKEEKEEAESYDPPKFLSLDFEEVEELMKLQLHIRALKTSLGELQIKYEISKERLKKELGSAFTRVDAEVSRIREDFGIPEEAEYELNLPENPGEDASLVLVKTSSPSPTDE